MPGDLPIRTLSASYGPSFHFPVLFRASDFNLQPSGLRVQPTAYSLKRSLASSDMHHRKISTYQIAPPEHRDPSCDGEVRTVGNWNIAIASAKNNQADADDCACKRGEQHDEQQRLPTKPCPKCCEQFEIAIAHAFLARKQFEHPVDAPQ